MAAMLAVSAMADTPSGSDKAFCFAQKTPMTFQWFETAVHKHFIADWKGFPDFVRSWDRKVSSKVAKISCLTTCRECQILPR